MLRWVSAQARAVVAGPRMPCHRTSIRNPDAPPASTASKLPVPDGAHDRFRVPRSPGRDGASDRQAPCPAGAPAQRLAPVRGNAFAPRSPGPGSSLSSGCRRSGGRARASAGSRPRSGRSAWVRQAVRRGRRHSSDAGRPRDRIAVGAGSSPGIRPRNQIRSVRRATFGSDVEFHAFAAGPADVVDRRRPAPCRTCCESTQSDRHIVQCVPPAFTLLRKTNRCSRACEVCRRTRVGQRRRPVTVRSRARPAQTARSTGPSASTSHSIANVRQCQRPHIVHRLRLQEGRRIGARGLQRLCHPGRAERCGKRCLACLSWPRDLNFAHTCVRSDDRPIRTYSRCWRCRVDAAAGSLRPACRRRHRSRADVAPCSAARRGFGGRDGPEPTRYGDWEKNGRCIDF